MHRRTQGRPPRGFRPGRLARGAAAGLRLLLLGSAALACDGREPAPSVLLVTLDTTRADHLGCYGYERDTSPNLDALAAESLVFERAYSTSSWTLPAHASLFTGKFPRSHGARYDPEGPLVITSAIQGPDYWDRYRARGVSPEETTLASLLRERGYATGAVVGGPWLKRVFGLDLGFDHYDDDGITETGGRPASDVTRAATTWLASLEPDRPFHLFLNYYDPHAPLSPPASYWNRFVPEGLDVADLPELEGIHALYDAEIRFMDHHLGLLLQELKRRGLFERCWIVVTADHGELLGENERMGHGRYLTRAELQVPMIVRPPGGIPGGERSDQLVQVTDVLPFLLRELGIAPPSGVQGEPLGEVAHPIVAEVHPLELMGGEGDWEAIVEGDLKLARSDRDVRELFDLARDPDETRNLVGSRAERTSELEQRLRAFLDALPPPGAAGEERSVPADTVRQLEGLGYLPTRESR